VPTPNLLTFASYCWTFIDTFCSYKALARAIYARQKTVVLDDVFSGMDAHTADVVSSRLLGRDGLLRKTHATVIVATHSRMPHDPLKKRRNLV
jgi:ABC-type transporter Mla maintaining outer membrane lipid asymmetry ATPase subunit MlaF